MTDTLPEQLRTFHITGQGLPGSIPLLSPEDIANGRPLPAQDPAEPFEPNAAIALAKSALLNARRPVRLAFLDQLRQTAERLDDLLTLDDSHAQDGPTPASLGAAAGQFLNAASLASALRGGAKPVRRMAAGRRDRCAAALADLRNALSHSQPPIDVFLAADYPDPCAAALAHCRRQLAAHEPVLRALRRARLELDGSFLPDSHEPILQRFHWQAAHPDEIAALPPTLAVLSASQAAHLPLHSLAALLTSGCPVHVLITQPALSPEEIEAPGPDFAQLAIALRDPFVVQGSLAYPAHLRQSLAAMAASLLPGLAAVATPSGGGWPESILLPLANAWPLFTFNPAASARWPECFQVHPLPPNSWTAAHAAACNPALANHFRFLPDSAATGDPIELDHYLAQPASPAIPFLTVAGDARVAVSRLLADFCRDRLHAASILAQWTAPPPPPPALSSQVREQAILEGAQLALAQVITLINKEGGIS